MKAIVAVDSNWGIGYKGTLLLRIPDDMKTFKEITTGKVVIMGLETFESLPNKRPLPNRVNIVLSNKESFQNEDLTICRSLDEMFRVIEAYPPDDVFVIGGESVYTQLLDHCSEVYVTKIQNNYTADKYFPNLDKLDKWKVVRVSEIHKYNDIQYCYMLYAQK